MANTTSGDALFHTIGAPRPIATTRAARLAQRSRPDEGVEGDIVAAIQTRQRDQQLAQVRADNNVSNSKDQSAAAVAAKESRREKRKAAGVMDSNSSVWELAGERLVLEGGNKKKHDHNTRSETDRAFWKNIRETYGRAAVTRLRKIGNGTYDEYRAVTNQRRAAIRKELDEDAKEELLKAERARDEVRRREEGVKPAKEFVASLATETEDRWVATGRTKEGLEHSREYYRKRQEEVKADPERHARRLQIKRDSYAKRRREKMMDDAEGTSSSKVKVDAAAWKQKKLAQGRKDDKKRSARRVAAQKVKYHKDPAYRAKVVAGARKYRSRVKSAKAKENAKQSQKEDGNAAYDDAAEGSIDGSSDDYVEESFDDDSDDFVDEDTDEDDRSYGK